MTDVKLTAAEEKALRYMAENGGEATNKTLEEAGVSSKGNGNRLLKQLNGKRVVNLKNGVEGRVFEVSNLGFKVLGIEPQEEEPETKAEEAPKSEETKKKVKHGRRVKTSKEPSRCAQFREELRKHGFDKAKEIGEKLGLSKTTINVQSWKVRKELESKS